MYLGLNLDINAAVSESGQSVLDIVTVAAITINSSINQLKQ